MSSILKYKVISQKFVYYLLHLLFVKTKGKLSCCIIVILVIEQVISDTVAIVIV